MSQKLPQKVLVKDAENMLLRFGWYWHTIQENHKEEIPGMFFRHLVRYRTAQLRFFRFIFLVDSIRLKVIADVAYWHVVHMNGRNTLIPAKDSTIEIGRGVVLRLD